MPTIRVFFTGMCLNAMHEDPQTHALSKVDVLMLTGVASDGLGYRHSPMLTVATRHIVGGSAVDRTVVSRPRGTDENLYLGTLDLGGFDYRLQMDPAVAAPMSVVSTPIPATGKPAAPADWSSIELVSDPSRATGVALKVDPAALPTSIARHGSVAATFQLTQGTLSAAKPPMRQSDVLFGFYPGQTQVFTDTTVVEYTGTPATVALIGEGFGEARGKTRRIELDHAQDIDIHVSNLPSLMVQVFDPQDFKPFYDVLLPSLVGNQRKTHAATAFGELVYCMNARAKV